MTDQPFTAADWNLDTNTVIQMLGIDPAMVKPNSVTLSMIDNKLVIQYEVIRAVPPRIMGLALIRGNSTEQPEGGGDEGEPDPS